MQFVGPTLRSDALVGLPESGASSTPRVPSKPSERSVEHDEIAKDGHGEYAAGDRPRDKDCRGKHRHADDEHHRRCRTAPPPDCGPSVVSKGRSQPGVRCGQIDGNTLESPLLLLGKWHLRLLDSISLAGPHPYYSDMQ